MAGILQSEKKYTAKELLQKSEFVLAAIAFSIVLGMYLNEQFFEKRKR